MILKKSRYLCAYRSARMKNFSSFHITHIQHVIDTFGGSLFYFIFFSGEKSAAHHDDGGS
jgi:hypothetical protein